jgi:DNA repair exonuclease SbcCD nuclease subunit
MSKVAITADVHFGVTDKLMDTLWACRVMREYCQAANIDTVLVLGDLYHDRTSIGIDVLSHVAKFFEDTKEKYNQTWIAFPGNHDMFLRHSWGVNSLDIMRRHMTVIDDVKLLTLDDRRFWVLPFITYEKSFMKVLYEIEKQVEDGDCLLTHIGVKGALYNTCFLLQDWSVVNFERTPFKRIYTGHFHSKQQIGENCWYPGSPIPFKFDEGDVAHGFYVYDLEADSHKFINIWKAGAKFFPDEVAPPQFHTFLDELLEEKTAADVSNNMIRVGLQREYTIDEKHSIRKSLMDKGARVVRWWDLITKKEEKSQITKGIDSSQHNSLFNAFLSADTKGTKELNHEILLKRHSEVINEGDHEYTIEESE